MNIGRHCPSIFAGLTLAAFLVACGGAGSGSANDNPSQDSKPADSSDSSTLDAADSHTPPDSTTDLNNPDSKTCTAGETKCMDETTVGICQSGTWVTSQICGDNKICLGATCITPELCQPGLVKGCYSITALEVCDQSGNGYVPYSCDSGQHCIEGKCTQLTCSPGTRQCASASAFIQCLNDGSAWTEPQNCEAGETCVGGQCLDACASDPKFAQSNVGCEFWSLDLGQWEVKPGEMGLDPSASTIPHGVVVGNPNDLPATVTFETGDGTPVNIPDPVVPAGQTKAFIMPVMSIQDSGISQKSIRLRTNRPVTAAQFNPPSNEDFVHTTDASLLFPPSILGTAYYGVSMPSFIGMEMPMMGKMPSVWGYVTIVAVMPGTTDVNVTFPCATEPGPDFPGYQAGQSIQLTLNQWDVLNVNSLAVGLMSTEGNDLTGTYIQSSQKIAAFSGHQCTTVGESNCDHLETSLLPVEAWGLDYVAPRLKIISPNLYRVVSGADNVQITTIPPVDGINGQTLNKGQWVETSSSDSFEIHASGPIQVVQFIEGNSEGSDLIDPSMTILVPNYQFRKDYPILVPAAYDKDFVAVIKNPNTTITLNGVEIPSYEFAVIPGGEWVVANIKVEEGLNSLEGTDSFGLISYGYASKVSYAYPAGLNGKLLQ